MPKAKLSQIATTWVDEQGSKERKVETRGRKRREEDVPRKKQTFSLRVDTIKRLWIQRIRTDKPLSEIMDDLVQKNFPLIDLENLK